jgi:hypothetical protein
MASICIKVIKVIYAGTTSKDTYLCCAGSYISSCDACNDVFLELSAISAIRNTLLWPKKLFDGLEQIKDKAAAKLNYSLEAWVLKLAGI